MAIRDRYGLPLSTASHTAAEHYVEGTDLLLELSFGPEEAFRRAVEEDEGFALAHAGLSEMQMLRGDIEEAKASADRAAALAAGCLRWERRRVDAVSLFVNGKGAEALALIREQLDECPRDALSLRMANRLFVLGCSGAGVADYPLDMLMLLKGVEPHYGEDWAFLGQYAFAHHECGLFDEALRHAERSLEQRPTNANASHSVAHVFFETGDVDGGGDFLGEWLAGYDSRAPFHVHLSWHLALFELAMGRYDRVFDIYDGQIRPSVKERSPLSLADSASLMWRIQVYGETPAPLPWRDVAEQAAPAAKAPGPGFRDVHAALAFTAAGDDASFKCMADGLENMAARGNSLAGEITLPLARGIAAFAAGEYDAAVERIEPIFPQLTRLGGSHAQREVFEDTLLEAYLRSGRCDRAEDLLRARLSRRPSARDSDWLTRARTGSAAAPSSPRLPNRV